MKKSFLSSKSSGNDRRESWRGTFRHHPEHCSPSHICWASAGQFALQGGHGFCPPGDGHYNHRNLVSLFFFFKTQLILRRCGWTTATSYDSNGAEQGNRVGTLCVSVSGLTTSLGREERRTGLVSGMGWQDAVPEGEGPALGP